MRRALLFVTATLLVAPLSAQQATRRFNLDLQNKVQNVQLAVGNVMVNNIIITLGDKVGGPVQRSSAEAMVRIDNNGATDVAAGVAIAVFDAQGNIVAAGSGGTFVGWLKAGERDTSTIAFPYVWRHLSQGKTFTLTLEVAPRPQK